MRSFILWLNGPRVYPRFVAVMAVLATAVFLGAVWLRLNGGPA